LKYLQKKTNNGRNKERKGWGDKEIYDRKKKYGPDATKFLGSDVFFSFPVSESIRITAMYRV
jgi:hypothetical protein